VSTAHRAAHGRRLRRPNEPRNISTGYARVDTACWGRSDHLSELQELIHNLGRAVGCTSQPGQLALHRRVRRDVLQGLGRGHLDVSMCRDPRWLLDCNGDNYVHTALAADSYLSNHRNVANSIPDQRLWSDPRTIAHAGDRDHLHRVDQREEAHEGLFAIHGGRELHQRSYVLHQPQAKAIPTLKLRILSANGSVLAQVAGPSVQQLTVTLPEGSHSWEVSRDEFRFVHPDGRLRDAVTIRLHR